VLELIGQLKAQGQSIILISHNMQHVFEVADRITVLRGGQQVGVRVKSETTSEEIVRLIVGASLH
jgi:ABC-type sugar transport system ATPase subunit